MHKDTDSVLVLREGEREGRKKEGGKWRQEKRREEREVERKEKKLRERESERGKKVREIKEKREKRKKRGKEEGKGRRDKDYGTKTRERLTNAISLRACKLSLREINIHFVSIKVSFLTLTISIMQPQCLLTSSLKNVKRRKKIFLINFNLIFLTRLQCSREM